jgi:hypothetical protein
MYAPNFGELGKVNEMVDPVTAALTGIALVTKIADGIKQGINAYNSVSEMGDQLELLFQGEQQAMAARNKQDKHSNFSTQNVAQEIIDHKLAQEKLRQVGVEIDMRFGHGTWQMILAERQRRIQEAREAAKRAAMEKRRQQHELTETIKSIAIALGCAALMSLAFVGAFIWT